MFIKSIFKLLLLLLLNQFCHSQNMNFSEIMVKNLTPIYINFKLTPVGCIFSGKADAGGDYKLNYSKRRIL